MIKDLFGRLLMETGLLNLEVCLLDDLDLTIPLVDCFSLDLLFIYTIMSKLDFNFFPLIQQTLLKFLFRSHRFCV